MLVLNITYTNFPTGMGEADNIFTTPMYELNNSNYSSTVWYNNTQYNVTNATLNRDGITYSADGSSYTVIADNTTITFWKYMATPLITTNNSQVDVYWNWSYNNVTHNYFEDCVIDISGTVDSLHVNIIDTSNNIKGNPIYIYHNRTGLKPINFTNAGQISLVNCNNSNISNFNIT